MGKKYKNPPVLEALCEFQFIPKQPWDLTVPGLIYERVKENFPDKQQQIGIGLQLRPTEKGIEHKVEPAPPRIQFFKSDKTALIQVAPDLLVVNQLKPYPTWSKFKPMIIDSFNVYKDVANPKGFRRIGLRYINNLNFSTEEIELKDYFKYYPFVPDNIPKPLGSFLTRVEFPYENGKENLILSLGSILSQKQNNTSLVLDIDYAMISPEYISFDNIPEWLEKAHERIENIFESCITDKLRNIFEEGKL